MRRCATFTVSLLLLAACGGEEEPVAQKTDYRPSFKPSAGGTTGVEPGAVFFDVTKQAGIDFVHVNGAQGKKWLPETMGSGVALFDYDNDGDLDLLFVQSKRWEGDDQPTMRLYRNDKDWKFTDVTVGSGLMVACYGMGATVADYDADGDQDVYVTCLGKNLLFRNRGNGKFVQVRDAPDGGTWNRKDKQGEVIGAHPSWSTGAVWFDADEDGDLDLLVVSYVRWTPATDIHAQLKEGIKAYIRPQLYTGDRPRLYLQNDDHSFTDASEGSGFDDTLVPGKSLAICLDDFDENGHIDVFVSNDTVQNFLFLGQGKGKFTEQAVAAGIGYDDNGKARAAMGIDSTDWRNDGRLAIAIGNFSEEPVSLYSVVAGRATRILFQDDANTARIGHPTLLPLTFGLVWADLDLDGWRDLLLANGHIEPSITELKAELQYEQAPQYFRNLKGKRFVDVSLDAGKPFSARLVGRGLATGDLDGDGDLDLVMTSNGGAPRVLRNDLATANRSLRLKLVQPGTKNPDALGATVHVTVNHITQRRVVRTGGSYLSQSDTILTFGLGKSRKADKVVVTWPDSTRQELGTMNAGLHEITRQR